MQHKQTIKKHNEKNNLLAIHGVKRPFVREFPLCMKLRIQQDCIPTKITNSRKIYLANKLRRHLCSKILENQRQVRFHQGIALQGRSRIITKELIWQLNLVQIMVEWWNRTFSKSKIESGSSDICRGSIEWCQSIHHYCAHSKKELT